MDDPTVNANYCPNCGSPLEQNVNYCSQCGTQCREVSPANNAEDSNTGDSSSSDKNSNSNEDTDLQAFRQRVQPYLQNGWEIEHDYGDSVVLVDRGIGSIWAHVVIFFCTIFSIIPNLIYGWYKYTHDADRMLLQAGENGHSPENIEIDDFREDKESSVRPYIIGSALLLIGISIIAAVPFSPIGLVMGLLFLSGAAWSFPPTKRRLKNRHPVTRFGSVRSTDEKTITDADRPCVICGSPIETGIKRSYREEYAVAGIPLFTTETGENNYCQECNSGDTNYMGDVGPSSMNSDGPTGDKEAEEPTTDEKALETEYERQSG